MEMSLENYLKMTFSKADSIVSRRIADEFILVPIRRKAGEVEQIYTLNEVGARIWELTDGTRTVKAVRDVIVQEYETRTEEVQEDLIRLLRQLEQIGALKAG